MKKLSLCLALVALFGFGSQAQAVIGTIDEVPAATLLLPYFEVDSTGSGGITTLFSINNASATAVLAHVTIWSDQSVPVLDFDVYLTGYDVQTINLRDILIDGNLPRTASAGQDPGDAISPKGPASQDINFASCTGILPYSNPAVSASFRAHLQAWLTGNASPATGNCAGARIKDGILRGYVTVDTVNSCNLLFPSQMLTGYSSVITYQNVLWGDYFMVNPEQNFAAGNPLVHIEAQAAGFLAGDHTFYGRYEAGGLVNGREALPTTFGARFVNGGAFSGGTDYIVWREGNAAATGYSCSLAGPSAWYPLDVGQIVIFDEEEQPVEASSCPSGDPTCTVTVTIPNEAQRTSVADDLLSPFDFGWTFLNLQHTKLIPAYGDVFAQAWVTVDMKAEGRYEAGFNAIHLDASANQPNTTVIPVN